MFLLQRWDFKRECHHSGFPANFPDLSSSSSCYMGTIKCASLSQIMHRSPVIISWLSLLAPLGKDTARTCAPPYPRSKKIHNSSITVPSSVRDKTCSMKNSPPVIRTRGVGGGRFYPGSKLYKQTYWHLCTNVHFPRTAVRVAGSIWSAKMGSSCHWRLVRCIVALAASEGGEGWLIIMIVTSCCGGDFASMRWAIVISRVLCCTVAAGEEWKGHFCAQLTLCNRSHDGGESGKGEANYKLPVWHTVAANDV